MDKGRHVNSMDRNVGVCFSSDSSLAEGALQDQGGAVGSPSRGATVAQTGMVFNLLELSVFPKLL